MKNFSKLMTGLAAGSLAVFGVCLITQFAGAEMAPASPPLDSSNDTGLAQFDLIVQRNIFDPNRGIVAPSRVITVQHRAVVETFSFRGAAEKVGQGVDGFFAGDGVPATGILDVNNTINGFKVVEISLHEAKLLSTNDELIILADQTGLTRQDAGPWTKIAVPTLYSSTRPMRAAPDMESPPPFTQPLNIPNQNNPRRNPNRGRFNFRGGAPTSQDDSTEAPAPIAQANVTAPSAPEN